MFSKIHIATSDKVRTGANLLFALSQIIVPLLPTIFRIGKPVGSQATLVMTPVQPATYAFAIWSVIFALSLAYAFYGLTRRAQASVLMRRIGWYTAAAFFFNTVWMLVAQFTDINWLTAIVIIAITVCAISALLRLPKFHELSALERATVYAPVSLLAGWVSAAMFVNFAAVLELTTPKGATAALVAAAVFAVINIFKSRGNVLYALTVVWALVAVVVANVSRNTTVAMVAGVLTVTIFAVLNFARKK